jgi:hypothetical protein
MFYLNWKDIILKFIRIILNIGLLTLIYGDMAQSRHFVQKFIEILD